MFTILIKERRRGEKLPGREMLKEGTKAPSFSLPDQEGKIHTLEFRISLGLLPLQRAHSSRTLLDDAGLYSAKGRPSSRGG